MILQDIYREIDQRYLKQTYQNKERSRIRQKEIYQNVPEIEKIDSKINTLGILIGYTAMHRNPPDKFLQDLPEADRYRAMDAVQLNAEIRKLNERKQNMLQSAGYPPNYMDAVYDCAICHDTGTVRKDGKDADCPCRRKLLAAKLKKAAGISPEDTFAQFDSSLYPAIADQAKYGISIAPKTQMEAVYKRCVRFTEQFGDQKLNNMAFVGNSGLGKTFLGHCIMNVLTDRGISCLYMPATSLFKPFAPSINGQGQEKAAETADFIMNCALLMIDDLGSEKQTEARYGELLEILNFREQRGRSVPCKTIITTNLSPANLFSYYGERVASRILGTYDLLKFAGEDVRLKRKCTG